VKIIEFDKDEPGFESPSASKMRSASKTPTAYQPYQETKRAAHVASPLVSDVKIVEFGKDETVIKPQPAVRHNAPSASLPKAGEVKIVEFGDDTPGFKPQTETRRNASPDNVPVSDIKIVEFGKNDPGFKPVTGFKPKGPLKSGVFGIEVRPASALSASPRITRSPVNAVQLYMFQTGTLKTKLKYIKMNQGDGADYEIPVPWFFIRHPKGNVVIDGGNAAEVAIDARRHWGQVIDAYSPKMRRDENCVEQLKSIGVRADEITHVLQSHLHLDHTGAIGRFPNATHYVQRAEYEYAFNPDWFSAPAYIRSDFDRPKLKWHFLDGEKTDDFDLFGDGTIRMIFTPGHAPGHQSFLINLQSTGPILLCIDAAYTMDHWENRALPGLVTSSSDAAKSVNKLHTIANQTGALVVTGHDPDHWRTFKHAPNAYYD
jgi:N-acyl homoserine lactone hydrolase